MKNFSAKKQSVIDEQVYEKKFKQVSENKSIDQNINFSDCIKILQSQNYLIDDDFKKTIFSIMEQHRVVKISFQLMLKIASLAQEQKQQKQEQDTQLKLQMEYMEAFVFLGGGPGIEGQVKKSIIKDVLSEFQLTFNIDEYLDSIQPKNNELNFESFIQIFNNINDIESIDNINSAQSLLSNISQRKLKNKQEFNMDYEDYQIYIKSIEL